MRGVEKDLLEARLEDAMRRCESGCVATLPFLTPRDRRRAEQYLLMHGMREQYWFWGGHPTAERACLFLLPDYLTACLSASVSLCSTEDLCALLAEEIADAVACVRIVGSGFRNLTHRDFLGSVLGLGLERDALGDVAVQNEHEAVVFCPQRLVPFLCENLVKVASDTVRCVPYTPDEHFTDGRKYAPVSDTVASPRLDCVVAALTNLSREAAQSAVRSGTVEVEFEIEERVDRILTPPAVISVRGHGRFVLRSFDGETRKGRLRMRADKLV
jgi:RNA-binding protein YlmH